MASRRYRRKGSDNVAMPLIFIGLVAHTYGLTTEMATKALTYSAVVVAISAVIVILAAILRRAKRKRALRGTNMVLIDGMSGFEFECYVAELIEAHGFTGIKLTERYDWGVDIIAHKNGIRWGIQTKRSSGLVKVAAVRQVVAGLNKYDCERCIVVTNGVFSRSAIEIAKVNDCMLIDRRLLAKMQIK